MKQSPRCWYKRFDDFINKIGFIRSLYDPCVYYKKLTDGSITYLLLYVDDMLLAGKNFTKLNEIKEQLKNEFEMKDRGSAKRILGMKITRQRSRRELFLSHKQYTKKVLIKFNMSDAKVVSTPIRPTIQTMLKALLKNHLKNKLCLMFLTLVQLEA